MSVVDTELAARTTQLRFVAPPIAPEVERVAPDLCEQVAAYGLPEEFAQIVTSIATVELVAVDRVVALPEGARRVQTAVLLSTVRDRRLVVDLVSGEVLFFTPQRDYLMNASFEAFVRSVAAYFAGLEGGTQDLRADIEAADPTALSDPEGLWEEAVHWWEIHQD